MDLAAAISLLRAQTTEQWRSPDYLEHDLLPRLGLNDEAPGSFPPSLHRFGGGLRVWQYPIQFSKYLAHISHLTVSRYAEIGCRWGGSFIVSLEMLRHFNPGLPAMAVDLDEYAQLREYANLAGNIEYLIGDSRYGNANRRLREDQDFVFIDGGHEAHEVMADFETVKNVARTIAFHDIVGDTTPGVKQFWKGIRMAYPKRMLAEFTDQYADSGGTHMGIGIIALPARNPYE